MVGLVRETHTGNKDLRKNLIRWSRWPLASYWVERRPPQQQVCWLAALLRRLGFPHVVARRRIHSSLLDSGRAVLSRDDDGQSLAAREGEAHTDKHTDGPLLLLPPPPPLLPALRGRLCACSVHPFVLLKLAAAAAALHAHRHKLETPPASLNGLLLAANAAEPLSDHYTTTAQQAVWWQWLCCAVRIPAALEKAAAAAQCSRRGTNG